MRPTLESSCEPAALAASVRVLAYEAYLALTGPPSAAALADLVRRATRLRGCLGDNPSAPPGPWLDNLVRALEDAGKEVVRRGTSPVGRPPHGIPSPAGSPTRAGIARA